MIRLTAIPRKASDLYLLLMQKERALRSKGQGTLHRSGAKRAGVVRWKHRTYAGSIRLQRCVGGTVAAVIQTRNPNDQWQPLTSVIGFLDRHFREQIASITITYEQVVRPRK